MGKARIRKATAKSAEELARDLPRVYNSDTASFAVSLCIPDQLSARAKTALYSLLDANIGPFAKGSSMEYDEAEKRDEMFEESTRIVLVLDVPGPSAKAVDVDGGPEVDFGASELVGFCSFRFDTEETMSDRMAQVLYCYEVQLAPRARGLGLGKMLMVAMEAIGRQEKMEKVMLTCLQSNKAALRFYAKHGYEPDEIDPVAIMEEVNGLHSDDGDEDEEEDGRGEDAREEAYDYRILSKEL